MPKWLESVAYFACLICLQQFFKHFFRGYYVKGKSLEQHFQDYRAPNIWILLRDGIVAFFCVCGGILCLGLGLKALGI